MNLTATALSVAGIEIPIWMHGRNMFSADFTGRDMVFAARDRSGSTLDRVRCVRTDQFKYIRNFHPERPYSMHSGYKELQYPGMAAARVLELRGELSGPPAAFWTDRRPSEELYDVAADPEELKNLAENEEYSTTSRVCGRQFRSVLNRLAKVLLGQIVAILGMIRGPANHQGSHVIGLPRDRIGGSLDGLVVPFGCPKCQSLANVRERLGGVGLDRFRIDILGLGVLVSE